MISLAIKRIVFSGKDNTFISCSPEDLEIYHVSAGDKFLKNQNNKENTETSKNSKNSKNNKNSKNSKTVLINKQEL